MRARHQTVEGSSSEEEQEKNIAAKIKARQESLRSQQNSARSGMDEERDDSMFSSSSDEGDW